MDKKQILLKLEKAKNELIPLYIQTYDNKVLLGKITDLKNDKIHFTLFQKIDENIITFPAIIKLSNIESCHFEYEKNPDAPIKIDKINLEKEDDTTTSSKLGFIAKIKNLFK